MAHHQHRLRRGHHPHQRAVLGHQHVAAAQHLAARQEHAQRAPGRIGGVEAAAAAHVPVQLDLVARLSSAGARPRPWATSLFTVSMGGGSWVGGGQQGSAYTTLVQPCGACHADPRPQLAEHCWRTASSWASTAIASTHGLNELGLDRQAALELKHGPRPRRRARRRRRPDGRTHLRALASRSPAATLRPSLEAPAAARHAAHRGRA